MTYDIFWTNGAGGKGYVGRTERTDTALFVESELKRLGRGCELVASVTPRGA